MNTTRNTTSIIIVKSSTASVNTMGLITSQAALYGISFLLTESSNLAVNIDYYFTPPKGTVSIGVLQYGLVTLPLQGMSNGLHGCRFDTLDGIDGVRMWS
jgi:hypothetical protein